MIRKQVIKPLGALSLAALLSGCGSARTTAAHKIADVLPQSLGPAAHYDVQVEGETFALARGRASRVHIVGEQVQVAPETTLDTLDVDARDVSLDVENKRVEKVGHAAFTGTVGQRNLTDYLAHRRPLVPGLSVRLRATDVRAEVPVTAAGLHTSASVTGTLAPDPARPDHLNFIADAASLGLLPIPARLVNLAMENVNPVFDLSQVKIPIALTRADVVNGRIVLQGTAHLENLQ